MNYISLCNVFLLVVFSLCASQIQCAQVELLALTPDLFLNECIVRHFGQTDHNETLLSVIEAAPYSKVVDAFIECPALMSEAYCRKICKDRSDSFIIYLRDSASNKLAQFYSALLSFPAYPSLNRRFLTRAYVVGASFMRDVPMEYYLSEIKLDPHFHIMLLDKASGCKTPEAKNTMTDIMNREIDELSRGPSNPDKEYFSNLLKLGIQLMNNEEIDFQGYGADARNAIIFTALGFNRYDIAEQLISTSAPSDLATVIRAMNEDSGKLTDVPRAVEILRQLLPRQADRNDFDALFRNRN